MINNQSSCAVFISLLECDIARFTEEADGDVQHRGKRHALATSNRNHAEGVVESPEFSELLRVQRASHSLEEVNSSLFESVRDE
jgi:hypothetical protein